MNTVIKRVWNQNRMVNIEDLRGMAFQAEDGGHTFEISGINDADEAVDLSGTVAGVFMRPDGTDVALTGTASDGVVSVTLSDACYAVAGRFGLYIFVTADSKKTCVYACIGTVTQTSYGTVAGDTPADVVDLVNAINAAISSIPADYTDLMAAIAPTYSDQSVYPAGAYRWYNGVLYKSKVAITTAEAWTAAHWTTAVLGNDVTDLTRAIFDPLEITMTSGGVYVSNSTGKASIIPSATQREYVEIESEEGIAYRVKTIVAGTEYRGVVFVDENNTVLSSYGTATGSGWENVDLFVIAPPKTVKMYVNNRNYSTYHNSATVDAAATLVFAERGRAKVEADESALEMKYIADGNAYTASSSYNAFIRVDTSRVTETVNESFVTRKYAVENGKRYKLIGERAEVNYDAYALAAFSTSDYSGTGYISCTLVVSGNGGTPTNYNVDFVAPANGYLYITQYSTKNTLSLFDAKYASELLYKLTNASLLPLKIQAFGDSITDDSWRTDKTSWLTLLPRYLTQRPLVIKNEAVGGSHIGHGKVDSETGKYHDLEYNYVYDLMTNDEIFDSSSDIIVMFVGTNDFNSSPLGEWGDDTVDTFYGAAKVICEYISENTSALFMVVTPIARPDNADSQKNINANGERVNAYGATLRDYADALIKIASSINFLLLTCSTI